MLVVLEHLNVQNIVHQNGLVHHGYRFVDFFFVLSGFVIAHAYRNRLQAGGRAVRSFLIRRVGRLWPLHVVMLGVFILFEIGISIASHSGISLGHEAFTDRNTVPGIGANLALLQGLGIFDRLTWNTPSWSISTEAFAYVLFAGVAALVPVRRLDLVVGVLLVVAAVVVLLVAPLGMASTYDFGVFRCIYGFMAGVLARRVWGSYAVRVGTAGEIVIVIAILGAVILLPLDGSALLVTPLFAIAVWAFAAESGAVSRALRTTVPQALGRWSYSIYMVHVLIALGILTTAMIVSKHGMVVFARVHDVVTIVGPTWFTTLIEIVYVAMVVLLASFTYRLIEVPGQRLFGRWAKS